MGFPEEIKRIRQRCFLTQHDFAKEVQVAFSTVNRWEGGKAKPNLIAHQTNIVCQCLDLFSCAKHIAGTRWLKQKS